MNNPRPIGSLITRLMARTGYDRQQGNDALRKAWDELAPASLQGSSQPGTVRRGVLEVFVSHSALIQEMGFHKRGLLQKLQTRVPGEGITDIRCRLLIDAGQE